MHISSGTAQTIGQTASNRPHIHYAGRVIAASRTALAILLFMLSVTDLPDFSFEAESDDLVAIAYFAVALVMLVFAWANWWLDFTSAKWAFLMDLSVAVGFFVYFANSPSEYVVAMLGSSAHILLSSALQWGWRFSLLVAVVLNLVWLARIGWELQVDRTLELGVAVRSALFFLTTTVIATWAGVNARLVAVPRFDAGSEGGDEASTHAAILDYARRVLRADGAALCWNEAMGTGWTITCSGSLEASGKDGELDYLQRLGIEALEPMLFDAVRGRAISCVSEELTPHAMPSLTDNKLLARLQIEMGICVPIACLESRGWLFVTGIKAKSWGHLLLALAAADEISRRVSWHLAAIIGKRSALDGLRQELARDLHDSVAQSLAGAKFLLMALRSKFKSDDSAITEIDYIRQAIEEEYLHVRRMIAKLREEPSDVGGGELIGDVESLISVLRLHWLISVTLVDSDFRINLPHRLSLDIQQIVREAVANAARHGKAKEVAVSCKMKKNALELAIADNGTGFKTTPVTTPRSIAERIDSLGGTLEIETRPGLTKLNLTIPLGALHD